MNIQNQNKVKKEIERSKRFVNKRPAPIIRLVGDYCNLNCSYCFHHLDNQRDRHVISEDLLENFLREYMNLFNGNLTFHWHGGEPLMAGLSLFQKIIEFENKYSNDDQEIRNAIQTNGTLINDKWAKFLKKHNFKVGLSLDGDKKAHNRFRKRRNGNGTFERVIKGLKTLRNHGIEPGVIQTLTHTISKRASEYFDYFVNILKLKGWAVNWYFDWNNSNREMKGESITNKDMIRVMKDYIDLWLKEDNPDLRIREIDKLLYALKGYTPSICNFSGSCPKYISFEYNGDIYLTCGRPSSPDWAFLGNIGKNSLDTILKNDKRKKYAKEIVPKDPECLNCKWYDVCHAGCPFMRNGGVDGKYAFCEARKELFSYLDEKVESIQED